MSLTCAFRDSQEGRREKTLFLFCPKLSVIYSTNSVAKFKVTRERIRQIEAKALRKLRHPSRSKKLKDYLE